MVGDVVKYRVDVGTSKTQLSPAKLRGVHMIADEDGEHTSVMAPCPSIARVLLDCINIMDSGSATTLAGKDDAEAWIRAGVATSVAPRETSVRHIRGIGAISRVCLWIKFTLDIGGALVTFHDVPVLSGHRGLLLGNDFLGPGRVNLSYENNLSGVLTIRDDVLRTRSQPVRFDLSGEDGLSFASETFAAAANFGPITPEERTEFAAQQEGAAEVEKALRGVDPIGWVPETTVVPAWCERDIWLRVPETLVKARDVLLLPLEDARRTDPGVLIAPSLARVTKDGYVRCRVINIHKEEKRLPLLTPLVRFQIDPRVYNIDYEHTVDEIIGKINVGSDLTEEEIAKARKMLESRRALFRSTLGYAHPYKMKLRLRGVEHGLVKPPNATLRVRSPAEEEALREETQKQLKAGLIERTRSPFNAVPMLVEKPTKEGQPKQWRTVIDYRAVNNLLEKDVYPLPNLEMNLARLGKANWYTTVDLLSGFWQVELADDGVSKEATAFSTSDGQFQWTRMPMGLASSPSSFMRLVDATLSGLPPGICLAYVDDIIIPTVGTFDDHMRDVGMVFDRLIESGFAVRCDKTHLGLKEVPYLGFMCGAYGTRPLASKTQAIFDMAIEDMWGNPAAAARYAGMLGFYGRFIPDLQQLLAPFSDLKSKSAPIDHIIGKKGTVSTPPSFRFITSFAATRAALANITDLTRPDFSKPFEIHVDAASSCGIGAALMQREDPEDPDSLRPIAFWSRRLQDEERGYDVREQECLGLDQTLKKWRHYLLGAKVHLLTDHSSLQWLLSTPHPDGSRVAGWALNAQAYDLTITWISGPKNIVADCLSRSAKNTEPVLETGASGENSRSIIERLEDATQQPDDNVGTSEQSPLPSPSDMKRAACSIQGHWIGYRVRSLNVVKVMQPYLRRRVARTTVGGSNPTANSTKSNIFEESGGTHGVEPSSINSSTSESPVMAPVAVAQPAHIRDNELAMNARVSFEQAYGAALQSIRLAGTGVDHVRCLRNLAVHLMGTTGATTPTLNAISAVLSQRVESNSMRTDVAACKAYGASRSNFVVYKRKLHTLEAAYGLLSLQDAPTVPRHHTTRELELDLKSEGIVDSLAASPVAILPPPQVGRLADRVALVLLRQGSEGQLEVAIENCEEELLLPSAAVSATDDLCYRGQLSRMLCNMNVPSRVISALPYASSFRARRSPDVARCQFFVQLVAPDMELHTQEIKFTTLNEALIASLLEPSDSTFLRLLAREVRTIVTTDVQVTGRLQYWVGSFVRIRARLDSFQQPSSTATVYASGGMIADAVRSIPSIATAPFGPALISTAADGAQAIELINNRLRSNPGVSLAVDLEGMLGGRKGHIDLMQLAVDATTKDEKQLIFVFDTDANGPAFLGQGLLRDLLEEPSIPKILHCCYGDCSSLWYEYSIKIRGVFDTGVADCLLRGVGAHKQRRLDKVMAEHVPEARLSLKGSFTHIPGMFAIRPLPLEYFVYSYEDVLYCNQLFVSMRNALGNAGLLELAWELSGQRAPPAALPVDDLHFKPPASVVVLYRDQSHMVCIQQADGSLALPSGQCNDTQSMRDQAIRVWEDSLGALPTKAMNRIFNSRLRKAIRIGDSWLVEVVVPDCGLVISSLRDTARQKVTWNPADSVVLRPCCSQTNFSGMSTPNQRALFQHIWLHNLGNRVSEVSVVVGKKVTSQRAAIIVRDDDHLFCLTTSRKGELQFPSAPIELGLTARETAIRAFDTYAGPSLNKHKGIVSGVSLMPESSKRVRAALDELVEVGQYGNTVFFQAVVPALNDLRVAFQASRAATNGFRLTATLTKRHPGYALCGYKVAAKHLTGYDSEAFDSISTHSTVAVLSQYSGPSITDSTTSDVDHEYEAAWVEFLEIQQGEELLEASIAAADSIDLQGVSASIPDVDADPGYDALFEAATLIRYSALVGALGNSPMVDSLVSQSSSALGTPPDVTMPTVAEMREAQRTHPALHPWIDYLEAGEWSDTWQQSCAEDRVQLLKDVEQYFLDSSQVLRVKSSDKSKSSGLVVVPPELRRRVIYQYHDRTAHFGVKKTLQLIMLRFDWGGASIMRHDVAAHIRKCHPCQLAKLPTHRAGEQQIGDNGQYPNDILCGDVYSVGFEEDGYDSTLDFACYFTRAISSTALQGTPDSETIIDVLLTTIISNMGVPSEIRSDQGSNFISKAVQLLYERMGIKMVVGTAYHHQLVALVERWHRTLGQLIRTHCAAVSKSSWGSKWYRCLPLMVLAYNSTVNASTGYSPFFLQHLREPRLATDYQRSEPPELPKDLPDWVQDRLDDLNVVYDAAARSLRLNALSGKRKYDLRHDVNLWFKPGDSVLLTKGSAIDKNAIHAKAELPNDGPFTVLRAHSHDRYTLADYKTRRFNGTFHVSRLIPYFGFEPEESSRWMISNSPGDKTGGQWPVHSLVGRRLRTLERRDETLGLPVGAQVLEYKIRWVGFVKNHDKWRAAQYLNGVRELVNEYDRHNPFTPEDMLGTTLEAVSRPDVPHPEPTEEARSRRHYRSHLNEGPPPPPEPITSLNHGGDAAPKITQSEYTSTESADDVRRRLHGSLFRLPVKTRVRVHYSKEDTWWIGTVTKSWLPRWRLASKKPAHHIWVEYDDPRYTEPVEHNVQESTVEVIEQEASIPSTTRDLAPADLDGKQRARSLRLERRTSRKGV